MNSNSIKNQTYPVVSAPGSVLLLSFRLFLADSHSKNVSREFFVSFRDKGQFATRTFCQGMFCDEELLGNGECCASALSKCPRQRLALTQRCPGQRSVISKGKRQTCKLFDHVNKKLKTLFKQTGKKIK